MLTRVLLTRALPAAAVLAASAWGGFLAYGHLARPRTLMATAPAPAAQTPPSSAAAAIPSAPAAATSAGAARPRRAIPDTLPDIAFADRHGVMRRLSDWKGHPLLVNFWAPWCGPCRKEIPLLERLSRQRARDGLRVIGVAVDSRTAVLDYARQANIQYPLLIGQQPGLEAIRALGLQAVFPFSLFVDARGRIVTVKIGELRAGQARLILDRIDDLDHGRVDLALARREISAGIAALGVARARERASTGL